MTNTSPSNDFMLRMKEKAETNRLEIEHLMQGVFQRLSMTLQQQSSDALNATEDVIREKTYAISHTLEYLLNQNMEQAEVLKKSLNLIWLKPTLIAISFLITMYVGSWAVMQSLSHTIQDQLLQKQTLTQEINHQLQALGKIETKTWGVEMSETSEGRFLIFPASAKIEPGWTLSDGRQAIKIGSKN